VQLTKLENPPSKTLTTDEIALVWSKIPKDQMIQFKLNVNLSGEVMEKVNDGKVPQVDAKIRSADIY